MKLIFFLLLSSLQLACSRYQLSLRQIAVDSYSLASTHVQTPDPRQFPPPIGQKIVLHWRVPPSLLKKNAFISLNIIYKNHTEKTLLYPIKNRSGYQVYFLLNDEFLNTGGLLTYSAFISSEDKIIRAEWKHQLFVHLITPEIEKYTEVD